MKKVQEQLFEYRKRKIALEKANGAGEHDETKSVCDQKGTQQSDGVHRRNAFKFLTFDLLNIYPMRKWREFCAQKPFQCWVLTASLWLSGQLLAAHVQFGFVYFVLSVLLLLLLNLGVRREGELSAYSVFNPNCERLLGQLTGLDRS
uniref:SAYSvFN domain-containing protein n=1 Tax=Globodera rostochiensis TaxID=31243 RepID=A0A914H3C4_GLORO